MKRSKKKIVFIIGIAVCFLLSGCKNTEKKADEGMSPVETDCSVEDNNQAVKEDKNSDIEEKYERFLEDYNMVLDNFKLDGFEEMGEEYRGTSYTMSDPCDVFPEEIDMIDDGSDRPVRMNVYYYNKKKKVLINVTHIFIATSMGNHRLTNDYPRDEMREAGIEIPAYEDYYMCYNNTLVDLKTIYTGNKKDFSIYKYSLSAVNEYIRVLEENGV